MIEKASLISIHKAIMNFDKRAERASLEILEATFVDSDPLFDLLSSKNNQIIYGRRGTGKTHALKYLSRSVEREKESQVYIDLRSVGSNGSIYSDGSRPLHERASTLIIDVLNSLYNELLNIAIEALETAPDPNQITIRIDDLANSIKSVRITGNVETEKTAQSMSSSEGKIEAKGSIDSNPSVAVIPRLRN